jgi:hypothetical protein
MLGNEVFMYRKLIMLLQENGMGEIEAERLAAHILEMLTSFVNKKLI